MAPIKDILNLKTGKHPRVGWVIVIGIQNRMFMFFISTALQIFRARLRFMPSMNAALEFLQDIDSTLPNLQSIDIESAKHRAQQTVPKHID